MGIFVLFSGISEFSIFSSSVWFGPFKQFSMVIFYRSWQKTDQKLWTTSPKYFPHYDLSLTSWLWMIDLEYAHQTLRMILRSVPDTINVAVLIYFLYDTAVARDKTRYAKLSIILLWPDLWRHQGPWGQQLKVSLDKVSRSVECRWSFVNWTSTSWVLRSENNPLLSVMLRK